MPYSPLYQSIRLILSGAIGVGICSTVAHANPTANSASTLPIPEQTIQSGDDITAIASENKRLSSGLESVDNDLPAQLSDDVITPITISNEVNEFNTSADNSSISTTDSQFDGQVNNQVNHQKNSQNSSQHDANQTEKALVDLSSVNAQNSLKRLANYYQPLPKPAATNGGLTVAQFLNITEQKLLKPTVIDNNNFEGSKKSSASTPSLDYANGNLINDSLVKRSARCEGQWIYPQNNRISQSLDSQSLDSQSPDSDAKATLYAKADYGYYDNDAYAELSGNVIIDQGAQHIEADKVVMDLARGVTAATGQVLFTDAALGAQADIDAQANHSTSQHQMQNGGMNDTPQSAKDTLKNGGIIGVAGDLAYDTKTGQSTAKDVAFASIPLQAHGYASKLNRPANNLYELDNVMFTTCPPNDRKWQIEAKNIDLDTDTGRGEAFNTTFKVADVPVLYLPYFNFPIDSRRASGFLLPNINIGSESGVELDVPYYFNIAPNYDATVNAHIYTNRNPMLTGEFRYLTANYGAGQLTGTYLPNDKEYRNQDRKSIFYDHTWVSQTIPRLSADATYNYVSDADYLNDFDTLGLSNTTINLPRRARLNYYNDYVTGELKVETFQNLNAFDNDGDKVLDKNKPYSRLPQLQLNYRLPWSDTINITGTHDSAYFKKSIEDGSEAEKSGVRIYNKVSASYPMQRSWGYVTPKLSLQHLYTSYDQDSLEDNQLTKEDGSQAVFVPQVSLDAGLYMFQAGSPFGMYDDTLGGYQLLSPRLKYTYSPYENQNDIPNFNTRIASINYQQLYSDSWFLGHDRLQDLHALTPGLNYRYIDAMGVTRLDASIAEQLYFDTSRVTLDNQDPVFTDTSSGLVWEASAQPYHKFWVDLSGALTNDYNLNYITTELRYQPTDNSLFNIGYINRQEDKNTQQLPLSAITASTVFPVTNKWRVLGQGQYDLRNNLMLDALIGVDYEDCCFGFGIYGRRYYNELDLTDKPTQAVMAEIRLKGLSSNSSRLTRLLSEKVLGVDAVQNAWQDR